MKPSIRNMPTFNKPNILNSFTPMSNLKTISKKNQRLPAHQKLRLKNTRCDYKVTVSQITAYEGIKCLVTTSWFTWTKESATWYTLPEVFELLPKPKMPRCLMERFSSVAHRWHPPKRRHSTYWFSRRRILPRYVYEVIDAWSCCSHPMAMFSSAILAMARESFSPKIQSRINKWITGSHGADALNRWPLPEIGTYIYAFTAMGSELSVIRFRFRANFHTMGSRPTMMRPHVLGIIHADHESGNVSAHSPSGQLAFDAHSTQPWLWAGRPASRPGQSGVLRWLQDLMDKMGGKPLLWTWNETIRLTRHSDRSVFVRTRCITQNRPPLYDSARI